MAGSAPWAPWCGRVLVRLARYRKAYPYAGVRRPRVEPVYGAVMLALEAAGVAVTSEIEARLAESGPGEEFFVT